MQIVIEIPDDVKAKIDDNINACDLDIYDCVIIAVKNGTPLPKGHGRLIDADLIAKQYGLDDATKYGNKNAKQQDFSYSTMMMYEIADMIDDAPTIIEADGNDTQEETDD